MGTHVRDRALPQRVRAEVVCWQSVQAENVQAELRSPLGPSCVHPSEKRTAPPCPEHQRLRYTRRCRQGTAFPLEISFLGGCRDYRTTVRYHLI